MKMKGKVLVRIMEFLTSIDVGDMKGEVKS